MPFDIFTDVLYLKRHPACRCLQSAIQEHRTAGKSLCFSADCSLASRIGSHQDCSLPEQGREAFSIGCI
jgi:hypothetical protein